MRPLLIVLRDSGENDRTVASNIALAGMTLISGFDQDITLAIPNGAMVEIEPDGERPFIRVV